MLGDPQMLDTVGLFSETSVSLAKTLTISFFVVGKGLQKSRITRLAWSRQQAEQCVEGSLSTTSVFCPQ